MLHISQSIKMTDGFTASKFSTLHLQSATPSAPGSEAMQVRLWQTNPIPGTKSMRHCPLAGDCVPSGIQAHIGSS